jgi:hypothetical protein
LRTRVLTGVDFYGKSERTAFFILFSRVYSSCTIEDQQRKERRPRKNKLNWCGPWAESSGRVLNNSGRDQKLFSRIQVEFRFIRAHNSDNVQNSSGIHKSGRAPNLG